MGAVCKSLLQADLRRLGSPLFVSFSRVGQRLGQGHKWPFVIEPFIIEGVHLLFGMLVFNHGYHSLAAFV